MNPTKTLALMLAATALAPAAGAQETQEAQRGALSPANPILRDPAIKTTFVYLGNGTPAVLYEPTNPGPKAAIAVFAMHSALDYLNHSSCTQLSRRGYRVLCANNANSKSGDFNDGNWTQVLLAAKAGVRFLKSYPGVSKVVLWGHSGGASVMTAYQNVAQNGVAVCQEAVKVWKCPDTLAGMPPADGVILGDPNWGIANDVLTGMDPAVKNGDGMTIDPAIDMYNPANGFDPKGSHFTDAFVKRFTAAQAKRNNEVIDLALARYAAIKAGKGLYAENEPFTIAGAVFTGNKLYASDMRLLSVTRRAWPLVHKDGSVTVQPVRSVRVPSTESNPSRTYRGALKTTVIGFLSTYAIRAAPDWGYGEKTDQHGAVYRSTLGSNPGNVEGVTVPFLTMAMSGSFEMGSAETIHDHVRSADKSLAYIEGATHNYDTCKKCEKTPGQYGDTMKVTYDYADLWLSKPGRFLN